MKTLKREGFTQSAIAKSLGRSRSTINREMARNSDVKALSGITNVYIASTSN
ncbi:helix-turn-helix domain-containing protein [bacterium]|nr:helix-turn-helix domain-containing protein [bacterium]